MQWSTSRPGRHTPRKEGRNLSNWRLSGPQSRSRRFVEANAVNEIRTLDNSVRGLVSVPIALLWLSFKE